MEDVTDSACFERLGLYVGRHWAYELRIQLVTPRHSNPYALRLAHTFPISQKLSPSVKKIWIGRSPQTCFVGLTSVNDSIAAS